MLQGKVSRVRCRVVKVNYCCLMVTQYAKPRPMVTSNYCIYEELTLCFLFLENHGVGNSLRSIAPSDLPEVQKAASLPAEICP